MHDVLVVGGGIAGLRAAIAAKSPATSVALITQSHPARSYSVTIQDGINGPESDDGWVAHVADTLAAGAGLNTTSVVESVCREAPELVAELDRMGVPFSRKGTTIDRVQLPGSRQEFTAYVNDSTGLAITQTLYEQAIGAEITIYNEWVVTSLIVEGGRCVGVVALDLATGDLQTFEAKAVVLATGGPRRAFEPSTASLFCSGAGIAAAYRAGAVLADMELVQYYPAVVNGRRLALSPLLWAWGATSENGSVRLDGSKEAGEVSKRFPDTLYRVKQLSGVDLLEASVPVQPAMSRLLGGVAIDFNGETSIPGLLAAGECASNGFHGAGGLDGNYVLFSVASGKRAGRSAARLAASVSEVTPTSETLQRETAAVQGALSREGGAPVAALRQELSGLMHEKAGPSRDAAGLNEVLQRVGQMREDYAKLGAGSTARDFNFGLVQYLELGSLLDVAEAIAASALERTESRGVHVRTDYPSQDSGQVERLEVRRTDAGPDVKRQPSIS